MNSVNTMSNTMSTRPGARAAPRGGQYFLPQRDTEHSDDEKRAMPQKNVNPDGSVPYRNITNYQFSRLQSAIKTARTRSDFGKLKDIIASGAVPQQNWHGKGTSYDKGKKRGKKGAGLVVPPPNMNGLASITENHEMQSASSVSENTDNVKVPDLGRFAGKGPRMNEDELAAKLAILSSGRRV